MDESTKIIKINLEENKMYNNAIVESIKFISENSEGIENNNYPTITTLCYLYEKINK